MTVEPLFDFGSGDFVFSRTGDIRLVTGKEALQNKIEKCLRTELGRYKIYSGSSYGSQAESRLVGRTLPEKYVLAEAERYVTEAVMQFDEVEAVDSFKIIRNGSELKIRCRVQSIYGSVEMSEIVW